MEGILSVRDRVLIAELTGWLAAGCSAVSAVISRSWSDYCRSVAFAFLSAHVKLFLLVLGSQGRLKQTRGPIPHDEQLSPRGMQKPLGSKCFQSRRGVNNSPIEASNAFAYRPTRFINTEADVRELR
jgi:hypothetical protein